MTGRKELPFIPNLQQIPRKTAEGQRVIEAFRPVPSLPPQEDDWLSGVKACDLSGEGTCEACQ